MHILVVEDERILCETIAIFLYQMPVCDSD